MKPAWDQLMRRYKNSSSLVIADVDCTAQGRTLCEALGVKGYPTIKFGESFALEDYTGGRGFEELDAFAAHLEKACSAARPEGCTEEDQSKITEYKAVGAEKRLAMIEAAEAEVAALEKDLQSRVDAINAQYKEASAKKDAAVKEVRESGLSLLKAIRALDGKGAKTA
mmetsp:Transcript_103540/g.322603  ORF Transcript_103540/g.322603 Transcript_103540/m.322603 type:complete len:168 (-) Transcript_103540:70-573(-)